MMAGYRLSGKTDYMMDNRHTTSQSGQILTIYIYRPIHSRGVSFTVAFLETPSGEGHQSLTANIGYKIHRQMSISPFNTIERRRMRRGGCRPCHHPRYATAPLINHTIHLWLLSTNNVLLYSLVWDYCQYLPICI